MPPANVKLKANNLTFSALSTFSQHQLDSDNSGNPSKLVILLHGFPDTYHGFDAIWPFIEENITSPNILVLAPSMRGYEPSNLASNRVEYDPKSCALDLISWIEQIVQNNEIPVHILAHDWGSMAAFKAANIKPCLITSMACLAIPYLANISPLEVLLKCPRQLSMSSYMIRLQSTYLYKSCLCEEALIKMKGTNSEVEYQIFPYIEKLWRCWSPKWNFSVEELSQVCEVLKEPGVIDGSTGYYHSLANYILFNGKDWVVDFDKVPTLFIGGKEDGAIAHELYDLEAEKLSCYIEKNTVKIIQLENVGHFLHRESPSTVIKLCANWFKDIESRYASGKVTPVRRKTPNIDI